MLLLPLVALEAAQFVLIDESERGHGPYQVGMGTLILEGRYRADVRGRSATITALSDPAEVAGPFFFTNQAAFKLGGESYRLLLTEAAFDEAYAAGSQTRQMEVAIVAALQMEEAAAAAEMLQAALATNSLCRNIQSVSNTLGVIEQRLAEEEKQRAAGRERFEGEWLPIAEVAKRRAEQHAAAMRAQGFELVDGEWLTQVAAHEKRLALAKEEAQRIAERERQREMMRCQRCQGSGVIYYELRPVVTLQDSRVQQKERVLRVERSADQIRNSRYETEKIQCPACRGSGQRETR